MNIEAYKVEMSPGDYSFYSPDDFEKEKPNLSRGVRCWMLTDSPLSSSTIEVYKGWCFVRPKYASAVKDLSKHIALYLGPRIIVGAA